MLKCNRHILEPLFCVCIRNVNDIWRLFADYFILNWIQALILEVEQQIKIRASKPKIQEKWQCPICESNNSQKMCVNTGIFNRFNLHILPSLVPSNWPHALTDNSLCVQMCAKPQNWTSKKKRRKRKIYR